jgi:hypothetical protein
VDVHGTALAARSVVLFEVVVEVVVDRRVPVIDEELPIL